MKRAILLLIVLALGFGAGSWIAGCIYVARNQNELFAQRAAWEAEKAQLEAALEQARAQANSLPAPIVVAPTNPAPATLTRPSPADIIAWLQAVKVPPGNAGAAQMRQVVYWLEELVHAGPAALPAIREYLARNEETEFDTASLQAKGIIREGKLPGDFVLPPSLRFGLFDVTKRIGGAEAEKILANTLSATGRGIEVAYLTRLLQDMAPNKYRDTALEAARNLLVSGSPVSNSALDRNHRDYLYAVLAFYNDGSFATTAQAQLLQPDGKVDRGALRYLQQSLGARSVPLAAQAYNDPRITDAGTKESFARVALAFAGADPTANQFYEKAINDPVLTKGHRSNLIEDLNEHGFADPKNLTMNDLPLIQSRLTLIEQLAPNAMDEVNAAAFKEAYKDLINMRAKLTGQPVAKQ
jgi:hypothetical protein